MGSLLEDSRECFQTPKKIPRNRRSLLSLSDIFHVQNYLEVLAATLLSRGELVYGQSWHPKDHRTQNGKDPGLLMTYLSHQINQTAAT